MPHLSGYIARSFGYRRLYVDAVIELVPERGTLAVVSEMARLGFSAVGSALIALIFWLLVAGARSRAGPFGVWAGVFLGCALLATWCVGLALTGLCAAASDLARVRGLRDVGG